MIRIEKSLVNLLILTLFFCAFAGEAAAQARSRAPCNFSHCKQRKVPELEGSQLFSISIFYDSC